MKTKATLIGLVFLFSLTAITTAQENQKEYKSVFDSNNGNKTAHGGYGAFHMGYSNINGKGAFLFGMRGAWIINHNIALGFGGTGFINNLNLKTNLFDLYLGGGYGGFYFEPIIASNSRVHVSVPILVGVGGVVAFSKDFDFEFDSYFYDVFLVFEPGVEIEFNMARSFRLAFGTSYRFSNGVLLNTYSDNDFSKKALNGFNFYVIFKFGKF